MLSSGVVATVVIFQLLIGFIAVILAAFCSACFQVEFAYAAIWWSFGWTLVTACVRWYSADFVRSIVEQIIHLAFEAFAMVSWIVSTGVLIALNIRLNRLRKEYNFDVKHNIALSDELVTHQFSAFGMGGLYCSYALNAVTAIIVLLFLISGLNSIQLLRRSKEMKKHRFDEEFKYTDVSTAETLVQTSKIRLP